MDRAALRIGQVHLQVGAVQRIPQLLLHALRAQGVQHQRRAAGLRARAARPPRAPARRRRRVQPGAVVGRVQVAADEVVGGGVAQVDGDAGDGREVAELGVAGDVFAGRSCDSCNIPCSGFQTGARGRADAVGQFARAVRQRRVAGRQQEQLDRESPAPTAALRPCRRADAAVNGIEHRACRRPPRPASGRSGRSAPRCGRPGARPAPRRPRPPFRRAGRGRPGRSVRRSGRPA